MNTYLLNLAESFLRS